jgi:aminoglycoside 3-N-acetyltransferase
MGEHDTVKRTPGMPATLLSLYEDFETLGVRREMVLLLHSSLSSLGWVCGGAVAVILALEEILGVEGTLVMPTHSGDLTDPQDWRNPPVPESWKDTIRDTMPPYDPDLTPTRKMGVIPEMFRKQRGVLRSEHPHVSFTAWGAQAGKVTEEHSLDFGLGEQSPLARVYDLAGWVLMLGVEHDCNTSLHLAEYRMSPHRRVIDNGAPLLIEGKRQWVKIKDIEIDDSDFVTIGSEFERDTGKVRRGKVACADAMLFPQRDLVEYSVRWMTENRQMKERYEQSKNP